MNSGRFRLALDISMLLGGLGVFLRGMAGDHAVLTAVGGLVLIAGAWGCVDTAASKGFQLLRDLFSRKKDEVNRRP